MAKGHVVMGLLFFPRGGSAQVARYLTLALADAGWEASLVAGSLGAPGEESHAPTFFAALDLHALDYTDALRRFEAGGGAVAAVAAPVPMHPSYEDREGAPDVVLAAVPPDLAGHLADAWQGPLRAAGADRADVFHLHHLTPQHDAVARHWPGTPVVAHLHGTEIKFLQAVEAEPDRWPHGAYWAGRLRRWAAAADHLVVVSPTDRATAQRVLGVEAERVSDVPNGVDVDRFRPRPMTTDERRARFRRWLVEDPQGWDETAVPGTVACTDADLDRLLGPDGQATVLVYVGRFTSAKRLPLLVRAFARARDRFTRPASLLVWGGNPPEWEGEHPVAVAREVGPDGIVFAGWRGHDDLPAALAASDALVMASVDDSYPQTPLEAMAVGLPVLATDSGGFPFMVNLDPARPTGWLVPPDDEAALADAIVEVVERPDDRRRRGEAALAFARSELSWAGRVGRFEAAYERARSAAAAKGPSGPKASEAKRSPMRE